MAFEVFYVLQVFFVIINFLLIFIINLLSKDHKRNMLLCSNVFPNSPRRFYGIVHRFCSQRLYKTNERSSFFGLQKTAKRSIKMYNSITNFIIFNFLTEAMALLESVSAPYPFNGHFTKTTLTNYYHFFSTCVLHKPWKLARD